MMTSVRLISNTYHSIGGSV